MIMAFVDRFMKAGPQLRHQLEQKAPDDYGDLVRLLVEALQDEDASSYDTPDPKRIHKIDDGDYQGTLVFVIGAGGYQPSTYWYVKVGYGSCSGCDTLEAIRDYSSDRPSSRQVDDYMGLLLNLVQGLKLMGDEEA